MNRLGAKIQTQWNNFQKNQLKETKIQP
jgi:hypothetical protein